MHLWKTISALAFSTTLLTACGGGGGNNDEKPNASTPTPTVQATPTTEPTPTVEPTPTTTASPTPIPDSEPPSAKITFPSKDAIVRTDILTVRGIATDNMGIKNVYVNDLAATLKPENENTVAWEITVPIQDAKTELNVSVEDNATLITNIDQLTIYKEKLIPYDIVFDQFENRIVGIGYSSYSSSKMLVEYDLENDEYRERIYNGFGASEWCLMPKANMVYGLTQSDKNTLSITETDLSTDISNIIYHINDAPDQGYSSNYNFRIHCNSVSNSLYVVVGYDHEDYVSGAKNIYQLPLVYPLAHVDFFNYKGNASTARSINISMSSDEILLFNNGKIFSVDEYQPSNLKQIGTHNTYRGDIIEGSSSQQGYITDYNTLFTFTSNQGTATSLEDKLLNHEIQISNVNQAFYDPSNKRLVLTDYHVDAIVEMNLETDERNIVLKNTIGDGPGIYDSEKTAFSEDGRKAYMIDSGYYTEKRVIVVDIESGERTKLNLGENPKNDHLTDIKLNKLNNYLYISYQEKIVRLDLSSGNIQTISSNAIGTGVIISSISSIELDEENGKIFYTDYKSNTLVSVNIEDGVRTLVSKHEQHGFGIALNQPTRFVLDKEENVAYINNHFDEQNDEILGYYGLIKVDLSNGNRELAQANCWDMDMYTDFSDMQIDEATKEIYAIAGSMYKIDLIQNVCTRESYASWSSNSFKRINDDFSLLGTSRTIQLLDHTTAQQVIISK